MNVCEEAISLLKMAGVQGPDLRLPPGQVSMEAEQFVAGELRKTGLVKSGGRFWRATGNKDVHEVLEALIDELKERKVEMPKRLKKASELAAERMMDAEKQEGKEAEPAIRFDPANPWPEGSIIYSGDRDPAHGNVMILRSVNLEAQVLTVEIQSDQKQTQTISFQDWEEHYAAHVDEVRFPEAGTGDRGPKSPAATGECTDWRLKSDPAVRLSECSDHTLRQELNAAEVNGSILMGCSRERLLELMLDKQLVVEADAKLPSAVAPTAGTGSHSPVPGAAVGAAPVHLPIPRNSDVSVDLIDVVKNIRGKENLFGEDFSVLGASLADTQAEAVKLMRLPSGRFRLLDGERRYRGAKAVGLVSLRADVYDQALTEEQILWLQLVTFFSKKDLPHADKARALAEHAQRTGQSPAEIGKALGCSDDDVRKHLAYLKWSPAMRERVDKGRLSLNKAITISRLPEDQQEAMAERCWLHSLSESALTDEVNAALGKGQPGPLALGGEQAAGTGQPGEETTAGEDVAGSMESGPAVSGSYVPGVCRACGCTEDHPCEGGCYWNDEESKSICNVCDDENGDGQLLKALVHHGLDADIVEKLDAANLETIGDLAELTRRKGTFWWRDLEGLKGFGEAAATKLDDALAKFHFARIGKTASVDAPPPAPARPTPPASNAWKTTPTTKLKVEKKIVDALVKAGLWCVGLVYDRSQKMGATWHQGAGLDLTIEEAAAAIVAIEDLWPPPPTDAHDQVNTRTLEKVNTAAIKGTKAQTAAQRHEQAKADSDNASRMERSPNVPMKFAGKAPAGFVTFNASTGFVEAQNVEITVTIGGKACPVRGTLKLQVVPHLAKPMFKAATAAAKKTKRR